MKDLLMFQVMRVFNREKLTPDDLSIINDEAVDIFGDEVFFIWGGQDVGTHLPPLRPDDGGYKSGSEYALMEYGLEDYIRDGFRDDPKFRAALEILTTPPENKTLPSGYVLSTEPWPEGVVYFQILVECYFSSWESNTPEGIEWDEEFGFIQIVQ